MTNPARIFVSHTPEDDEFCQDLVSALRSTGADVWSNDRHYALSQLLPVIEPEVRARPIFIVILSPAALRSGTVTAACTWAATYLRHDPNRRFLPVLAQPVDDTSLRAFFEGFHTPADDAYHPHAATRSGDTGDAAITLAAAHRRRAASTIVAAMQPMRPMHTDDIFGPPSDPQSNPQNGPRMGRFGVVTAPPQHVPHAPHAMVGPHADDDVESLIVQGNAQRTQGRHDEALVTFQQAMQRNPQSAPAWFHLGFMFAEMARYPEALGAYDQALALDEQYALSLGEQGERAGAVASL